MEENKSAYDHLREKATDTNEAHDTLLGVCNGR